MTDYAVITENDESPWEDVKGEIYHFPHRYAGIITSGCKVIYYTGRQKNTRYGASRLSSQPHYFGMAEIGQSVEDPLSHKGDLFCEILNYHDFEIPVLIRDGEDYIENISESLRENYWRSGVRKITESVYEKILSLTHVQKSNDNKVKLPSISGELESFKKDGSKKLRYSTYYERNPFNRKRAIEIHGLTCMCCGFNFGATYGNIGQGYIQVHHLKPVSELSGATRIDPGKDLVVLCGNCHSVIHKDKENTLSIHELTKLLIR